MSHPAIGTSGSTTARVLVCKPQVIWLPDPDWQICHPNDSDEGARVRLLIFSGPWISCRWWHSGTLLSGTAPEPARRPGLWCRLTARLVLSKPC